MITEQHVREYVRDRTIMDNDSFVDLSFSNADIQAAMRTTARMYNGIPPYVNSVRPDNLPDHDNTFFDGIAAALYRGEIMRLSSQDFDYSGGSVQVNHVGKRIEHFKRIEAEATQRFMEAASNRKRIVNLHQSLGAVG